MKRLHSSWMLYYHIFFSLSPQSEGGKRCQVQALSDKQLFHSITNPSSRPFYISCLHCFLIKQAACSRDSKKTHICAISITYGQLILSVRNTLTLIYRMTTIRKQSVLQIFCRLYYCFCLKVASFVSYCYQFLILEVEF